MTTETIDISTYTLDQLKALAYDLISQIETAKNNLNIVNKYREN